MAITTNFNKHMKRALKKDKSIPKVSVRRLHLDEGLEFLRTFRVCGRRVDLVDEDLFVVGLGDGQVEPGQQLRIAFAR